MGFPSQSSKLFPEAKCMDTEFYVHAQWNGSGNLLFCCGGRDAPA